MHGSPARALCTRRRSLLQLLPPPQIVYEFLLRYVVSSDTDAKVAKRHIDQNFVVHLLDLFDSGARLPGTAVCCLGLPALAACRCLCLPAAACLAA